MSATGDPLDENVVLLVEELSKRTSDVHELRYAPTVSIAARLTQRRDGIAIPMTLAGPIASSGGDDDDDDDDDGDDDDDDFNLDLIAEEEEAEVPEWPLRDVTFQLGRGESVGLVGERFSVMAVIQVLSRTTTPTAGRVVYRGRMGLSSELAKLLAQKEMSTPRLALKTLSTLAGVPRRARRQWARTALELMVGSTTTEPTALELRRMRDRLPVAAALDPDASILLIDQVPPTRDDEFRARYLAGLRDRIAGGASAVIACRDITVISELCTRVIWIEDGAVKDVGEPEPILREFLHARDVSSRGELGALAFNSDIAVLSAFVTDPDGRPTHDAADGSVVRVRVHFEIAQADTSVTWRVRLDGPTPMAVEQRAGSAVDEPGSYVAKLAVPKQALDDGDYRVTVEADVAAAGRRSVVQRALPGVLHVSGTDTAQLGVAELTAEWSLLDEALL